MIYTLILTAINLLSNSNITSLNIFKNDIEQGLIEVDLDYDFKIPDYYSTQEQLDMLV